MDENYPKSLVAYIPDVENKCTRYVFAKYSMEGGNPQIESIFFYKLDGIVNIFSIVSWDQDHRALGTYGKLYQVYAYKKDNNGILVENKYVVDDNSMTGIDGYENGESSKFLYKKASDVKAYFTRKKIQNEWIQLLR